MKSKRKIVRKIVRVSMAGCESVTIYPFGELTEREKIMGVEKPHIHLDKYPDRLPQISWDSSNTFHYIATTKDLKKFADAMLLAIKESKKPVRLLKRFAHEHYCEETLKKCILV